MTPDLLDDRAAAARVQCPLERCHAPIGEPCVNVHTGRPLEHLPAHIARLRAAGVQHAPWDVRDLRSGA